MMARLKTIAHSYLDHIRIAVEVGDVDAPFRTFIDNWAALSCEAGHHRNGKDRIVWFNNPDATRRRRMLLSLPFRSAGADAILDFAAEQPGEYRERRRAKDKTIKLIVDHAIPISVLVRRLFDPGADLSREGLEAYLKQFYCLGLLSHVEDGQLNGEGLRSRMPAQWNGIDLVARYNAAKIVMKS